MRFQDRITVKVDRTIFQVPFANTDTIRLDSYANLCLKSRNNAMK